MAKIPVTIYTLPNCVQCESTKRLMTKLGIEYSVVDLTTVPDKVAEFRELGLTAAPIVTTDIKIWSGFRHGKIQSLAHHIFSQERHEQK